MSRPMKAAIAERRNSAANGASGVGGGRGSASNKGVWEDAETCWRLLLVRPGRKGTERRRPFRWRGR